MNQKTKSNEDLSEFRAGLAEPVQDKSLKDESDPDISDELVNPSKSAFGKATITVALQFLAEDGHPKGRPVIVIVKGESAARPIKLLREADLGQLPEPLATLLAQLQLEINSQKAEKVSPAPAQIAKGAEVGVNYPNNTSGRSGNPTVPTVTPHTSGAKTLPDNISPTASQEEVTKTTSPSTSKTGQETGPKQASLFDLL